MSRDFSKVAPNVWQSRKFWQLPDDDARLCYLYVLTCPHANSAGCYDLPIGYGSADLRWDADRFRKALQRLSDTGLIVMDEGENTVLVTNWTAFNEPTNGKHALGILAQLSKASSDALKAQRALEYQEIITRKGFGADKATAKAIATFFEALRKPLRTETRPETETQTRPDLDREKTETRETFAHGVRAAAPDGASLAPSEVVDHPLMRTNLMRGAA